MFIDAYLGNSSFITDDEKFRDSFKEECFQIAKRIVEKPEVIERLNENDNKVFIIVNGVFWFGFVLNISSIYHPIFNYDSYDDEDLISDISYKNLNSIEGDLFTALLYKKAEEFGYELKAATDGGENSGRKLIFIKPSAPAK